eukprot:9494824-Pyramimonas_sp.AAC.1
MRPYFAGSKFAAACDTVWRQALRSEVGTSRGKVSATVLWDMTKFYETFQLDRLLHQCRVHGFPMVIAQLCVNTYRSARFISMSRMVSGPHYALL